MSRSDLVKSWKLNEIVSSSLNPLRYCMRTIRNKFARIACQHQLAYCYTIIDANNRISLPVRGEMSSNNKMMFFATPNSSLGKRTPSAKSSATSSFNDNPLDSFFPFDPYLLKRSKPYIEKFYQEFQDNDDDDEVEDNEEEDSNDEDEDNQDDEDDMELKEEEEEEEDDDDNNDDADDQSNSVNMMDSDLENSVDDEKYRYS